MAKDEITKKMEESGGRAADLDKLFTSVKGVLASAPTLHEVLARPMVYEAWLKKAQEALNG